MRGPSNIARLGLALFLSVSTVAPRPAIGNDLVPLWKSSIPRSVDGDLESATVAVLRELPDGHWLAVTGGPFRRAIRRIAPGGSAFTEASVADAFVGASAAVDSFGAWVDATDSGIVKRDVHGELAWSAPVQPTIARGCTRILIDDEGDVFVLWGPGSIAPGNRVSKLDGRTGALLWSSADLPAGEPGFVLDGSTIVSDSRGDVVAAFTNTARTRVLVVRLRGASGQEQWRALEPVSMYFTPAAGERSLQVDRAGDVFLASNTTVDPATEPAGLSKLSGTTGGRLWRHLATGISDLSFTTSGWPLAVLCTQTAQVRCSLREVGSGSGALLREMPLPDPPPGGDRWRVFASSPSGVAGLLVPETSAARVRLVSVDLASGAVQPPVIVTVPSSRPLVSARFEGTVATFLCASRDPSILLPPEIVRADSATGAVPWRLALPSLGDGTLKGLSAVTTAGGVLAISESHLAGLTAQQRTTGLDPASGRILWGPFIDAESSPTANAGSPVVVGLQDDILVVSAVQDTIQLQRRNAATGQREWGPVTVSGVTPLSLQIVPLGGDFLLFAPYTVTRHAGGSGAEIYRVSPGGGSQHSIAATPDGTAFYVGWWAAGFAYVTKRDAATGAVLWTAGGPGVFGSWTPYAFHLTEQGDVVAVFLEGAGFMPSWVNLAVLKGSSGTLDSLSQYVYSTRALVTHLVPGSSDVLLAGLTAPAPVRRLSPVTGAVLWNAPVEAALQFLYPTRLRVTGAAVEVLFRGSGGTAVRQYALETGQIVESTPVRTDLPEVVIQAIEHLDHDWCLASQRAGVTEVLRLTQGLAVDVLDPLPGGRCGSPYSKALTARNPSGNVTFELTAGSLPEGIQLTSTGVVQGTPQGSGRFAFDVKLTSGSQTAGQTLELFVLPSARRAHLTASPSPAIRGRPVTISVVETASGYSWQPGGGTLPTTTLTLDEPTDVTLVATDGACGLEGSLRLEVVPDTGGIPAPSTLQAVTPCRVVDTRDPNGVRGGPALPAGQMRSFPFAGTCGVPLTATAVAVNVTAINAAAPGFLRVGESASASEGTRAVAFGAGSTRAGFAILGLERNASGNLQVFNDSLGTVDVVLDVSGYFE